MFNRRDQATSDYKRALKDLHDNQAAEQAAGVTEETDTYRRLNKAVLDAEEHAPWWRR